MTTQVIATEKYHRLFQYLAEKQKEWAVLDTHQPTYVIKVLTRWRKG